MPTLRNATPTTCVRLRWRCMAHSVLGRCHGVTSLPGDDYHRTRVRHFLAFTVRANHSFQVTSVSPRWRCDAQNPTQGIAHNHSPHRGRAGLRSASPMTLIVAFVNEFLRKLALRTPRLVRSDRGAPPTLNQIRGAADQPSSASDRQSAARSVQLSCGRVPQDSRPARTTPRSLGCSGTYPDGSKLQPR